MSTLHLVYMGQDNNTAYSVVVNVAIKWYYMLCCVQLVHQVYCFSSWTETKLIINNDIPPACLLKKALTINCNLTLPAWPNLVLYPDPEQGSGDTQYNSIVLTAENVVANWIWDNKKYIISRNKFCIDR